MKNLTVGTRVYYTGDIANLSGTGTIVAVYPPTNSVPQTVGILMDSERFEGDKDRLWHRVLISAFAPGPGCQFTLLDDPQ